MLAGRHLVKGAVPAMLSGQHLTVLLFGYCGILHYHKRRVGE